MRTLPVYELEASLVDALRRCPRLIFQAPPGSGKSTQIPQMLLDHGLLGQGMAVILEPRRLAARMLSRRVAFERKCRDGDEIGYRVRFDNRSGPSTRIRFETEGMLLRQMIDSPDLRGIQAIVFDEFHERHLFGDLTLARAVDIQERHRPDLLLIVMSATLDAGTLERYLAPCTVLRSEGREYPVEVEYTPPRHGSDPPPVWDLAAAAFARTAASGAGDVLVFMPGAWEIGRTLDAIAATPHARGCVLLPLHGELSAAAQDAAVARYPGRKVVVSTNVAETSITMDGVRTVIDSGLARVSRFDSVRGINTLMTERISRASADQRAGRAGRTGPGLCIRLWPAAAHGVRPAREEPEIHRVDLAEAVLMLRASGVEDLARFRWLDAPHPGALDRANALLADLGAVDPETGAVTPIGRRMLAFPVHPRYARMLLAAGAEGCVELACLFAALMQGRDLFVRDRTAAQRSAVEDLASNFSVPVCDATLWLAAWIEARRSGFRADVLERLGVHEIAARQAGTVRDQFLRMARAAGLPADPDGLPVAGVLKCVLSGFGDRVARRLNPGNRRCELVHGRRGDLARDAMTDSMFFVATGIEETRRSGDVTTVLERVSAVLPEWFTEVFPADVRQTIETRLDSATGRVIAEATTRFRGLVLGVKAAASVPPDDAARLLSAEVISGRIRLDRWDAAVDHWVLRLNRLAAWCPELNLAPIGDDERRMIIEQLCHGVFSVRELQQRDIAAAVTAWLSPKDREILNRHAPEKLRLPNGKTARVTYDPTLAPSISIRIQELYGVRSTPRIAMGRVAIQVKVLAPSMRPIQVTEDLANFWDVHYPVLKTQLQRRYPRHEWR